MRTTTDRDGRLIVSNDERWVLVLVVALAIGAGLVWLGVASRQATLAWSVGMLVAATLVLAGWERSTFAFDPRARELQWCRGTPYRDARGAVPFADITMLSIEQGFGPNGARSGAVRLVLHTTDGVVPFTNAYTAGRAVPHRVATEVIALLRGADPQRKEIPLVE